jgi:hypothetical protein
MEVLSIEAIRIRLENMNSNRKRGFSMQAFAKFACVDYRNMKKMFFENSINITETTQRRLSRALLALEKGEAGMRMDIAGRRFLGYHPQNEVRPTMKKSYLINMNGGVVQLTVQPMNKYEFTQPPLLKKKGRT